MEKFLRDLEQYLMLKQTPTYFQSKIVLTVYEIAQEFGLMRFEIVSTVLMSFANGLEKISSPK